MKEYSLKKTLAAASLLITVGITSSSFALAKKPKLINLSIDNKIVSLETNAKNIEEVLDSVGYKFEEGSKINHELNESIENNMNIKIDTKKNISFVKAGILLNTKTYSSTVEDFLKEQNVEVDSDDLVIPSLDSKISNGEKISVDFYDIEKYSKKEEVPFKTVEEEDFNMDFGKNKVKVSGVKGIKEIQFEKVVKNGKLVSNSKTGELITKNPKDEILVKGTKEVVKETIDRKVTVKHNDSMYTDEEKVIEAGKDGLKEVIYKNNGKTRDLVSSKTISDSKERIVEKGTKERPANYSSSSEYSLEDLQFHGIINWDGYKYTYYSQSVLPGGGLRIPGRHVNDGGFVADSEGYIVVASDKPLGSIVPTPFGYMGKVYDRGTYGNHIDIYTR